MPVYTIQKIVESLEDHSWSVTLMGKVEYFAFRSGNHDIRFHEDFGEIEFYVDGWICSNLEQALQKSRKLR